MHEKEAAEHAWPEAESQSFSRFSALAKRFSAPFFVLLILLGIGCRFYGLNWDDGTTLHPDERFMVSVVARLTPPTSASQFFDSRVSTLNPANIPNTHYVYGQLPVLIGSTLAQKIGRVQGNEFLLVGRFLAALFDSGTILLTLLIARRLFSKRWALLAAALVAGAALHIQQSHFFVVDPFVAFFLTASFWAGVRLVQNGRRFDAALCGLFFGAALACKISAVLYAAALLGFLLVFARRNTAIKTITCTLLCALAALLAFRVGHPMAFQGEYGFFDLRPDTRFWIDVNDQRSITNGVTDVPFNVQWIGRTPWLYSLRNLGSWGYGWLFLLSAVGGTLVLLKNRRSNAVLWVAAIFALALVGVQGAAFSKFTRYFLPLTPMCALLAVYFWREMSSRRQWWQWGAAITAVSVALWGLSVTSIYGRPNTRLEASRWIVENVPSGTFVANETDWDEGLPISWYGKLPPAALNAIVLDSYDVDTLIKCEELARALDKVEWIFLSSGRSWQNIPRWPEKWPMMTAFYRSLFNGNLGFQLEKKFTSFPRLGPFEFSDLGVEEALTVYDHPVVLLFHKVPGYDGASVRHILEVAGEAKGQNWQPSLAPKPDEATLPMPPGF
jgi:4-amino-4-deoxy-L-arabinose transferase-like glycosyltransferase